jgi:small-conductance mechanosensitive channel
MDVLGIRLVGVNPSTGKMLLFTIAWFAALLVVRWIARQLLGAEATQRSRARFWARQAISIALAVLGVLGFLSIWFEDPRRLTTVIGLVSAGIAFALQKVVTAFAGYVVILRGRSFRVGDRIVMGGVRGDVVRLDFMQTHIMEMGQPPTVEANADPAMWVRSRQYTGRIVTISNDKIFEEPVYNYTREFPYIWEETRIPIRYDADRGRAERILLDAARRHTTKLADLSAEDLAEIERRYAMRGSELEPRVYFRMTDNWLELTVRFIVGDHGIREIKDAMSRDILAGFDDAGIDVASTTIEIVGFPALRVRAADAREPRDRPDNDDDRAAR